MLHYRVGSNMNTFLTLCKTIDQEVHRVIDKELAIRLNPTEKDWMRRDDRLKRLVKEKELILEDFKDSIHNMYNEVLLDFLKENQRASHFITQNKGLACILNSKEIAAITISHLDCKPPLTLLCIGTNEITISAQSKYVCKNADCAISHIPDHRRKDQTDYRISNSETKY